MLDLDQKMNLIDTETNKLHQKIDFAKPPVAKGASSDSPVESTMQDALQN